MKRWFAHLPIHRKLVVTALAVTTAALALATLGLVIIDVWRYRSSILDDTIALAAVIAENTAGAVLFNDPDQGRETLASVRVRPSVPRACLYLPDERLFAGFGRTANLQCAGSVSAESSWFVIGGRAAVTRNQRVIGTVYVERDLAGIWPRGVAQLPPRSTICEHMNLPLYSPTVPASGVKPG